MHRSTGHPRRLLVLSVLSSAVLLLAGSASQAAEPRVHKVSIKGMVFAPATLEVRVGDRIEWSNDDFVPHTVTSARRADGGASFDSGVLAPKARFSLVVAEPGAHPYVCTLHPGMKGAFTATAE